MIPEWNEKSFLYRAPSQVLSSRLKKFFVRGLSSISQRSGKANRMQFRGMVLATAVMAIEQYKGRGRFVFQSFIPIMSNIIPLPFESTLSSSYADASELAQAMQRLERHLAHVINIRVTGRLSFNPCSFDVVLTFLVGLLESWPLPSGAEQFQMRELMDCLVEHMLLAEDRLPDHDDLITIWNLPSVLGRITSLTCRILV